MNRATRDKFASGTDQSNLTGGNATWQTPPAVFADLNAIYGFDIDICANKAAALLPVWFGPGSDYWTDAIDDDLSWHQYGNFGFCNPPYGAFIKPVVYKAVVEAAFGFSTLLLLPLRMTQITRWAVFESGSVVDWLFCDKRITFFEDGVPRLDRHGNPSPALFDSMLVLIGPGYHRPRVAPYHVPDHVPAEYRRGRKVA